MALARVAPNKRVGRGGMISPLSSSIPSSSSVDGSASARCEGVSLLSPLPLSLDTVLAGVLLFLGDLFELLPSSLLSSVRGVLGRLCTCLPFLREEEETSSPRNSILESPSPSKAGFAGIEVIFSTPLLLPKPKLRVEARRGTNSVRRMSPLGMRSCLDVLGVIGSSLGGWDLVVPP